jgi:hypothetical protein
VTLATAAVALLTVAAAPARPERVWLVIGASDSSPAEIARKARALSARLHGGIVVQTADCGVKPSVFAWVAEVARSEDAARSALERTRAEVSDAYVKPCDVRPGSLLSLRVTAVDPSIADVPADAVNWSREDRVSSAVPLKGDGAIVIVRAFAPDPEDPLEGRRERLVLARTPDQRVTLDDNCVSAGAISARSGAIALHCAREQAGDHLLHSVLVFDAAGKKVAEVTHCRDPRPDGPDRFVCRAEAVDAAGRLTLRDRRIDVSGGAARPRPR